MCNYYHLGNDHPCFVELDAPYFCDSVSIHLIYSLKMLKCIKPQVVIVIIRSLSSSWSFLIGSFNVLRPLLAKRRSHHRPCWCPGYYSLFTLELHDGVLWPFWGAVELWQLSSCLIYCIANKVKKREKMFMSQNERMKIFSHQSC